jgi:hypothetical protein
MEKTLTILLGNARGGEETWETLYSNLLAPYDSDLALCFGETKKTFYQKMKSIWSLPKYDNWRGYYLALVRCFRETSAKNNSLYQKAKYVWELPEYDNWRDYYSARFPKGFDGVFQNSRQTGIMGGIDDATGSGAIIFAFRDFILKEKRTILEKYDRIILTRADFYYLDVHPILPLGEFHVVEGEDYGGITDRHHIFDSDMCDDVLGICDYLCNDLNFNFLCKTDNLNPEEALLHFFNSTGIAKKINRCKRVQFTVSAEGDESRWMQAGEFLPGSKTLKHKYYSEYTVAKSNLNS